MANDTPREYSVLRAPDAPPAIDWYADHGNLVVLTRWMANHGYEAGEVAYAVEKPWQYESEWIDARREAEVPQ